MALYLKGKKLADSKVISVGGKYNIEVIDKFDEYGNKYQTLNITDWDYLPYDRVFGNNTPAHISAVSAEIAKKKYTSEQVAEIYGWNLGDTIPITLSSGENIEMQIIGINHDTLSSDHTSKAGLTLQMKECLATKYPMNSSSTNAGGYAASKMKNETLPTIKALLPQEWQDVIKLVDKKSANGGSSNYSETLTLSEDLFLLSEIEIFGTAIRAEDSVNEGSQYEYWNGKTAADRIKKYSPTVTIHWWLRSSAYYITSYFITVNTSGDNYASDAKNPYGISFAFCV